MCQPGLTSLGYTYYATTKVRVLSDSKEIKKATFALSERKSCARTLKCMVHWLDKSAGLGVSVLVGQYVQMQDRTAGCSLERRHRCLRSC